MCGLGKLLFKVYNKRLLSDDFLRTWNNIGKKNWNYGGQIYNFGKKFSQKSSFTEFAVFVLVVPWFDKYKIEVISYLTF